MGTETTMEKPSCDTELGRARGAARLNQEIGMVRFLLLPSFTHLCWEMGQELLKSCWCHFLSLPLL